jgi:hypothetical protein
VNLNEAAKPELVRPMVACTKLLELLAALPPCVIAGGVLRSKTLRAR